MHIFISEYLCGGGWPDDELPASLLAEGRAMLRAVIEDFSRLPGTTVQTTWDTRFSDVPTFSSGDVTFIPVRSPAEEQEIRRRESARWDAALVIAPEFDRILQTRCEDLRAAGVRLLNSDAESLSLTADKFETFQHCRRHRIPTIESLLAGDVLGNEAPPWFPCVAKLRDGAGGLMMTLLTNRTEWQEFQSRSDHRRFLLQPFLSGRALSVAAIVDQGTCRCLLPVGEQRFAGPSNLTYLGGRIPASAVPEEEIAQLVRRTVQSLPGLSGWTGFDILLPDSSPDGPLLVEVNPRLTTSYVGYRQLTGANLARWLLNPEVSEKNSPKKEDPLVFRDEVFFQSDGQFEVHHRAVER